MNTSLIIATYNNPEALSLVLQSILNQVRLPEEVIIADDGSTDETKELIEKFKHRFSVPLLHVWQEDAGFRLAAIRNLAMKASSGEYFVFSDGDLFLHPYFMYDFKRNMKKGEALIGSRVFLNKQASVNRITHQNVNPVTPFFSAEIEANRLNSVRFPSLNMLFGPLPFSLKLRGGLLGISRTDIIQVNGWNEAFKGWGLEDTELIARLHNADVVLRKIKFQAVTYHLWHKNEKRESANANFRTLSETIQNKSIRCVEGFNEK